MPQIYMKVHNYSCGLYHKSSVGVVQVESCLGYHHVMWSSVGYGRPSCDVVKCWVWETIM